MRKTLFALFTAAGLAAFSLSGCSSQSSDSSPSQTAETAASDAENAADSSAEDSSEETSESSGSSQTAAIGLDKMVFTYVTSPLNVPSIIERSQGIFADAFGQLGIDVEYAEITSGADQTQALASGDVQVLYAVGGSSVILSAANGADIKIVNMYSRSPKAFCLYTKDETLTTPESLAGKTIGGPVGTNLHELLAAYLATADMSIDDVNYVNMTIPDAMAALEGGSLDVAMVAGATAYQAQQSGYHLVTDGEGLIDATIAVAVTEEFADTYPQLMDTLTAAQEIIADFMENQPDETLKIVAQELDLDTAAVEAMYPDYNFSIEITENDIAGLQRTADFMLDAEMIQQEVDASSLFLEQGKTE